MFRRSFLALIAALPFGGLVAKPKSQASDALSSADVRLMAKAKREAEEVIPHWERTVTDASGISTAYPLRKGDLTTLQLTAYFHSS